MKILHYLPGLPPIMGGGMIKYALNLVQEEFRIGHQVIILTPGHFTHFHKKRTKIIKTKYDGKVCYRIINPLPVSGAKGVSSISQLINTGKKEVYIAFLNKIKPEIIHIHNLMGIHIAFLEAAVQIGIPIIYTTHDYYGICPKATLLRGAEQCRLNDGSQCSTCIPIVTTIGKLKLQQSLLYDVLKKMPFINFLEYSQKLIPIKIYFRVLKQKVKGYKVADKAATQNMLPTEDYEKLQCYYREMFKYITSFHFNSNQSKQVFVQYLGKISGQVVPISVRNICDRRRQREFGRTLRIGFIGYGAHKGFGILKDALDFLYTEGLKNIECHVYFNPKEKLPSYIISHAPYKERNIDQVYNRMDLLVLPSICKETYGLVVLEALSYGIPVIVSQNVGAKELLAFHNNIGIVIEPTVKALKEVLEKIYYNRDILKHMNVEICNCKLGLNYEEHVCKMVDMYYSVCNNFERGK